MVNSRLNIDVYAHIIDLCYDDTSSRWLHESSYPTWLRTSLVCSDWLPRSQFNIFRDVEIRRGKQYNLLLRTISASPHLADLIVSVKISSRTKRHIGNTFDQLLHPRCLKNCRHIDLDDIEWRHYPAQFADTSLSAIGGMQITRLCVAVDAGSCGAVITLLYSLPLLQHLTCRVNTKRDVQIPKEALALSRGTPCPFMNLKELRLLDYCPRMTFPPLMFGFSVTSLSVNVHCVVSGTPQARL
ncbi:hypothetical protein C8Q74DRAFT_1371310 [Fomes fomentarius]|nr:hypothetical protein C8Q74DRAFT_1371310 [Fomes fomentarius]